MRTKILGILTLIMFVVALYGAFVYAPNDREQGIAQRIFTRADRNHGVPVRICSVLRRDPVATRNLNGIAWPMPGRTRITFHVAIAGDGDDLHGDLGHLVDMGRGLTLQLVLWLIFVAYFMLRSYLPDRDKKAKLSAVFGLLGAIDVPLNYLSIRLVPTQHPQPVVAGGEGSGMEPEMWVAFIASNIAFLLLYAYLMDRRIAIARVEDEVEYVATLVHAQ
jgi:heme exporter protein C